MHRNTIRFLCITYYSRCVMIVSLHWFNNSFDFIRIIRTISLVFVLANYRPYSNYGVEKEISLVFCSPIFFSVKSNNFITTITKWNRNILYVFPHPPRSFTKHCYTYRYRRRFEDFTFQIWQYNYARLTVMHGPCSFIIEYHCWI